MTRSQLFEIAEQPWCPALLRRFATDAIAGVQHTTGAFDPIVPLLALVLARTGARRVVDLCAGSGGPWRRLLPRLTQHGLIDQVLLTDLAPPAVHHAWGDRLRVHAHPVDATDVPLGLGELHTLFNGLHHLSPEQVRRLLAAALHNQVPIAAFEVAERRPAVLAFIVLVMPWMVVLSAPWLRPFSMWRLVLTWVLPVVPLMVVIDGVISCLRVYEVGDLDRLVRSVPGSDRFDWSMGRQAIGRLGGGVTWLVGVPRPAAAQAGQRVGERPREVGR